MTSQRPQCVDARTASVVPQRRVDGRLRYDALRRLGNDIAPEYSPSSRKSRVADVADRCGVARYQRQASAEALTIQKRRRLHAMLAVHPEIQYVFPLHSNQLLEIEQSRNIAQRKSGLEPRRDCHGVRVHYHDARSATTLCKN
jgi:hypothetical protein